MLLLMKPYVSLPYSDDLSSYSLGVSTTINVIDQKRNVIDLEPGLHTIISVTPEFVHTSDNFDKLPYWSRNCKLSHETYSLETVKNYSRITCEHECAFKKAISICKCTPWYYVNNFTIEPICEMFGGYCFNQVMSTRKFYRECSELCLDDCSGIRLSWEKTFRPINVENVCKSGSVLHEFFMKSATQHFSHDHYNRLATGDYKQFIYLDNMMRNKNISGHFVTLCQQFVKKHIAIVTVESPTDVVDIISRDIRVTFMDQIGIIGGTLGLFTGVSMISILDFISYIYKLIKQYKGENLNENCENKTGDFF